ncbi:MAG: hypothetical protein FWF08_01610 [Oscillospiraceae bacterium]|nr:hypothetical protein [Oscillospiraceae bacterium]
MAFKAACRAIAKSAKALKRLRIFLGVHHIIRQLKSGGKFEKSRRVCKTPLFFQTANFVLRKNL